MSRSVRIIVAIFVLLALAQAVSLVERGSRGDSDVSVFHRTGVLLRSGIGGELYPRDDAISGWPISLAPAGLAIFQPLSLLSPLGASIGWALINLSLLGLSVVVLYRFLKSANTPRLDVVFPSAVIVLVVLSAGSIQVGQFSVLFATCWILFVSAFAAGGFLSAGMLLAIPSAIKVYPLMMLAVPLSLAKTIRIGLRVVLVFLLGIAIFSLLIPFIVYGPRAWDLNLSFWKHVILSPTGQVAYMQTLRTGANQSLDTVLLRYLTYDPEFHGHFVAVPHLQLAKDHVLQFANLARLVIFLSTAASVWQWRRRQETFRGRDILMMSALWSCTLYLMLPETKARYAVYTFLGFLPLLEAAADAARSAARLRVFQGAQIVLCVILIAGLLPESAKVYGAGFIGALVLWLANLKLVWNEQALGFRLWALAEA